MRRRTKMPSTMPAMPRESKPRSIDMGDKTFRVSNNGKTETVKASTMKVENDGLTFMDGKGGVVAVFRGYGLSAVCEDCCTTQACEPVRCSDLF